MYERNALDLLLWLVGRFLNLVMWVLAVPVLLVLWWEAGNRGLLVGLALFVFVRVRRHAARQWREVRP